MLRTFLWAALRRQGVPEPVMRALWELYAGGTAHTLIQGVAGRPFGVDRGIRQGCRASGSAWAILDEPIVRRIRRLVARVASVVPGGFADDIGVVANEVVAVARVVGALASQMTAGGQACDSTPPRPRSCRFHHGLGKHGLRQRQSPASSLRPLRHRSMRATSGFTFTRTVRRGTFDSRWPRWRAESGGS